MLLDVNVLNVSIFRSWKLIVDLIFVDCVVRFHPLKIALEGTNAFKHWLDAEDQLDYFYPGYKNTRHVFLSPFEGICGLKGRL